MPRDRDEYVPKHGVPVQIFDDVTAQHSTDPARLRIERAKRPTDKRLEKLEEKHDALDDKVNEIGNRVARMEGKLDTALDFIKEGGKTERTRIHARKAVIVAMVPLLTAVAGYLLGGCA